MILNTERLILRPWDDRDRDAMIAIQGDAQVRRFYPKVMSPDEVNEDIDRAIERARTNGFHWQAAELKESDQLIGLIGLGIVPDKIREAIPSRPRVEIGWVIGKQFWGKGFAPEGARAWLDYAWSIGLPEVVAFTAKLNTPSQRVMQKINMAYDPSDDYHHPTIPKGHPLRPHLVYRKRNPYL